MNKHQRKLAQRYRQKFTYASMQAKEWMHSDDPDFQRKGTNDLMEAAMEYKDHLLPLFTKNKKLQKNKLLRYCREHG